ncbi:hypothetical protein H6F67_23385 [Microcoleus sp. FACHB-1515]|uniref:hypothetical protein n=1 Tax=Cyanophyceae TaxID=3028117 RepID=UPI001689BB85|nr:hypothetical protein [Microcoleus sp. FACHB-1515]MBD2092797.1 hypothetical protein [Microcoleus sp. FACHB-1515]
MSFHLANFPAKLLKRQDYQTCHVRVAGESLAAICVDRCYYSFFKIANAQTAAKLIDRLQQRGDRAVLTQTPKGYAIWVLELDALPLSKIVPYRILSDTAQYRLCQIRVPDLDQNLSAIEFENRYYSLFRLTENSEQALPIVDKLSDRGDQIIITETQAGYSLWILEAEAWKVDG